MTDLEMQIRQAYAAEQTAQLVARCSPDIPSSFEAISEEWLTAILCVEVPRARVIGAPGNGSGFHRAARSCDR